MSFEAKMTNGEIHAIMRRLGISSPDDDPIGLGIGMLQAAARRLGHPITWEDAEALNQEESDRILTAADTVTTGTEQQRSEAITALLDALPATTSEPDPE